MRNDTEYSMAFPLHDACRASRYAKTKRILERYTYDLEEYYWSHRTPLLLACKHNSEKCALLLLDYGAHVDTFDGILDTPLQYACYHRKYELIRRLLLAGAKIDTTNIFGWFPRNRTKDPYIHKMLALEGKRRR